MERITMDELVRATGGRLISGPPSEVRGISIDSRTVKEGEFFVALRGERFDGHDFAGQALLKADGAIVSIPPVAPPQGKAIVHVPNTLIALQGLARHLRLKYGVKVLGITGSNGKTTTKEMSALVLGTRLRVLKNTGNLNNQIGLPMSLLGLGPSDEAAVLEMGASAPGDIRELCGIAVPDFGILTNAGYAHMEGFGDLTTVCRTKMELLDAVPVAAVNADSAALTEGMKGFAYKGRLMRFGLGEGVDVRATDVRMSGSQSTFRLHIPGGDIDVSLRVPGIFNIHNALAAASAGVMFGMGIEDIKSGLEAFSGVAMRLELKELDGATVISDVYNANPGSMEEALKELVRLRADRPGGRAIAVLGDMLELGTYSATAHRNTGALMAGLGVDVFIAVGREMEAASEEFRSSGREAHNAPDALAAREILLGICRAGDTVLIKGSRGMKMENVLGGSAAANGERR